MNPSKAFHSHRENIRRIVEQYNGCNARIFGSVLHGNDTDDSDLNLLIDPTPETTLMDIGAIRYELNQLLSVPVDVLTPKALPDRARKQILNITGGCSGMSKDIF